MYTMKITVFHRHAARTAAVKMSIIKPFAHVFLAIMVHHLLVAENVPLILTVRIQKLALMNAVSILALALALHLPPNAV